MEIRTSYATLRVTADRIIDLTSKMCGIDRKEISIYSAINNDLGVDGDDWVDLQRALKEQEGIPLDGLHFYDYFHDESQIADPMGFFNVIVQLIWYFLFFKWLKMKFEDFYEPIGQPTKALTVGNLITSKFEGRFVKRSEIKFVVN